MKNLLKQKEFKINPYTLVCIGITLLFVWLSFSVFPSAYIRLFGACKDFVMSFGYYFFKLFNVELGFIPNRKTKKYYAADCCNLGKMLFAYRKEKF